MSQLENTTVKKEKVQGKKEKKPISQNLECIPEFESKIPIPSPKR
jgi:hypothetical protein